MSFIHQKGIKQKLKYSLLALIAIYIMVTTSLYFLQDKILFRPTVLPQDHVFEFKHEFEEIFLTTEDEALINAIHFKAEKPKGIILYFHGNAGDLQRWGTIAEFFVDLNYDVFIMDYRTYGKSTGILSEEALYKDAQMCYDYVKKIYNEEDITVYGRSLGTGIATYVASKNRPEQLILETPYYSIVDVAKYRFPIVPVKKLMQYELPTYDFIKEVECKTTMIHGTDDYIVPYKSGKKLFDIAPKEQTTFVTVEGGSHNNLMASEQYTEVIKELLKY